MHDDPLGSSSQVFTQRGPKAVRAEFTGETGYQKFPSIFFILCGYIKYVYIYLYIYTEKLSPIFLWVSKFDAKLGVLENYFRNYPMYVSFHIFGSKLVIFDFDDRMVFWKIIPFHRILENLFLPCKIENIRCRTRDIYMVLCWWIVWNGWNIISVLKFSLCFVRT